MMKKFLAVLLICAVCLSPALAATGDLFPAVNAYSGFADVEAGAWYADAVRVCYETGLMKGTGEGSFTPAGGMSVAEAATIAARIREIVTGQPIPSATPLAGQSREWYDDYVDYLTAAGVTVGAPTVRATRAEFFAFLAAVVPNSELEAINAITALPDTQDADVLRFYNAGILTGTDDYGTFNPTGGLSRAECATMVARVIRPALRQRFTPQVKPTPSLQEELSATAALMVNGKTTTMTEFVNALDSYIFEADYNLYVNTGRRLDWSADYGVGDLATFFIDQTKTAIVREAVLSQQAKALGCTVDDLPGVLSPDPSHEVLSGYAEGMGYLAAKHILLQTYDPNGGQVTYSDESAQTLAKQIIDALNAQPTYQQFENLSTTFNCDPGMTSYPEGYLFRAGEMVSEFENAVRALEVDSYTLEPVKSVYGYHVILRLDPADLTELKTAYQEAVLDALAESWADSATVTVNQVMLDQLDVKGCYEAYWALLAQQAGA